MINIYYILIIILVFFFTLYVPLIERYENNNNITIILTSTVYVNNNKSYVYQKDTNERINIYIRAILQWLNKTNFNIVLIENSGYNFNELNNEKEIYKNRFEVITFKENELDDAKELIYNDSKGASEIFAINYAFNNSNLIKNYNPNFIIKITARYFIPELESYLNNYDLDKYDCLTQNNRNRCEMVGSHIKNFQNIFNSKLLDENNNYDGHIENIWKYRTMKYDKVLVCKEFNIKSTQRGGLNEVFNTL